MCYLPEFWQLQMSFFIVFEEGILILRVTIESVIYPIDIYVWWMSIMKWWVEYLTAAYLSTKGRKRGSSRRALSLGNWRSPSFSPLSISLFNNHQDSRASDSALVQFKYEQAEAENLILLEIGVVENERVLCPCSLESWALLVAPTLKVYEWYEPKLGKSS